MLLVFHIFIVILFHKLKINTENYFFILTAIKKYVQIAPIKYFFYIIVIKIY